MPNHSEVDDAPAGTSRWYDRPTLRLIPGIRGGNWIQIALAIPYYTAAVFCLIGFFGFLFSNVLVAAAWLGFLAVFVVPMGLWVWRIQYKDESTVWDWLLPGYRTSTWWKAVIASCYYIFCALGVAVGVSEGSWQTISFGLGSLIAGLLPLYGLALLQARSGPKAISFGKAEGGLFIADHQPAPHSENDHDAHKLSPPSPARPGPFTQSAETPPMLSPADKRDLQRHITEGYPFPIAFPYRLLGGNIASADKYREQLRLAENFLAFLASLSLGLLAPGQRAEMRLNLDEKWRKGISPGDWREIIIRCSPAFAAYPAGSLQRAIADLNIARELRGFGRTISVLIRAKNDFKHDRGPASEEEFADAAAAADAEIDYAFGALGFLQRFPIREVRDVVPQRNGSVVLRCLRYTGDHPGFAQEDIESTALLVRGDLYVTLADNQMTSLHPFLVTKQCPRCRSKETYFVDKWSKGSASAFLKSFERGHIDESVEVAEGLSQWETIAGRPPAVG